MRVLRVLRVLTILKVLKAFGALRVFGSRGALGLLVLLGILGFGLFEFLNKIHTGAGKAKALREAFPQSFGSPEFSEKKPETSLLALIKFTPRGLTCFFAASGDGGITSLEETSAHTFRRLLASEAEDLGCCRACFIWVFPYIEVPL